MNDMLNSLDGMNVTMPYKQAIIPYLERLDETAEAVGAVNVVHKRVGYNTDCIGFMESIRPLLSKNDRKALVLGTGGASKAVCYGLKKLGLTPTLVSRTPKEGMLGYDQLTKELMNEYTNGFRHDICCSIACITPRRRFSCKKARHKAHASKTAWRCSSDKRKRRGQFGQIDI